MLRPFRCDVCNTVQYSDGEWTTMACHGITSWVPDPNPPRWVSDSEGPFGKTVTEPCKGTAHFCGMVEEDYEVLMGGTPHSEDTANWPDRFYHLVPTNRQAKAQWLKDGRLKKDGRGIAFSAPATKSEYVKRLKEMGAMNKLGEGNIDRNKQIGVDYGNTIGARKLRDGED